MYTHTLWHTYTYQAVVLNKLSSQSALLCYNTCVCVTWLIRTFGITHPYVCHESVLCVMHERPADACNSNMTRSCTWYTMRWLFCALWNDRSLLQKSPMKESIFCNRDLYNFKEPINRSQPIRNTTEKWLSYAWDRSYPRVWYDSLICELIDWRVIWLILVCDVLRNSSFLYVRHTHPRVWHDSLMFDMIHLHVTWLTRMWHYSSTCGMNHSHMYTKEWL